MLSKCMALFAILANRYCSASTPAPPVPTDPRTGIALITMGGTNKTLLPKYPDDTNYSLWIQLGGRSFDTAWEYHTQRAIAAAIEKSGVARSEFTITTKIPGSLHGGCCGCPRDGIPPAAPSPPLGPSDTPACIDGCHGVCYPKFGHYTGPQAKAYIAQDLEALGSTIGYIDFLLLHEPCDYVGGDPTSPAALKETATIWAAMEEAQREQPEKIRALGVSNFDAQLLGELAKTATVPPVLNQCRYSAGSKSTEGPTVAYCEEHNITYQAYSPLHGKGIATSPVLAKIAQVHGVSNQVVVMRWITQQGIPLVTASDSLQYDQEDLRMFSFKLSEAEMLAVDRYTPAPPSPAGDGNYICYQGKCYPKKGNLTKAQCTAKCTGESAAEGSGDELW